MRSGQRWSAVPHQRCCATPYAAVRPCSGLVWAGTRPLQPARATHPDISDNATAPRSPPGCPGDDEARSRGTQKSVLERKAPPTFPLVIEMRERAYWVTHWVEDSVDCLLTGKVPIVQARRAAGASPGRGRAVLAALLGVLGGGGSARRA